MTSNILESTKQLAGIEPEDTSFDLDIITYINSTIATLYQIGVESNIYLVDDTTEWNEYLSDSPLLGLVKDYISKKVRLKFDPPSGSAFDALKSVIEELEWRISVEVDPGNDSGSLPPNQGFLIINTGE